MRYIEGICQRCSIKLKLDIGDLTLEEARVQIQKLQMFECPGFHVFIADAYKFYDWDWEVKEA